MTNKKITELTELTIPVDADILPIVDDIIGTATTKKITYKNIQDNLTITSSQVSDFDTEVSNNSSVTANTAKVSYTDASDVALNTTHRSLTNNPHSVDKTDVGLSNVPNLDCSNASNISSGTLSSSVLPPVALTTVQVAVSEAAQLALTTEEGDVVVRSDENKSYMKNSGTAGTMSDFTELQTPTDSVLSVNSKTGSVVLNQDNIGDGSTYVQTHNDFTDTYKSNITTNNAKISYNSTASTKLGTIEESADVTDSTNVVSSLSGATLTGALTAADHGTAATDQVVNVCYGTGSAPTASTTTEGTLFVKYTA